MRFLRIQQTTNRHSSQLFDVYDLLIQARLFSAQGITAEELYSTLRISRNTLASRLKEISPEALLDIHIESHRKYYSLNLSEFDKIITAS